MSSVQKRVVHVLSWSPASLSPVLTPLWCHPQCTSCLNCVTLPPPVWEPWGTSRHGHTLAMSAGLHEIKGGMNRIDKKDKKRKVKHEQRVEQGKEKGIWGRERERMRSQSSPSPDQRAVSLILQIQQSACLWAFPVADRKERKNTCGSTALKWCYFYFFKKEKSGNPCWGCAQGPGEIKRIKHRRE